MTERRAMNKPHPSRAKPLAALVGKCLTDTFAQRGFASTEIVTHWVDIAGADIAAHCEPMKIEWPRRRNPNDADPEPAVLVLRVEGPCAIEIQHQTAVIIARVNRFFGWPAIGRIALRQAPLRRRRARAAPPRPDAEAVQAETKRLSAIADDDLRSALGRLGAAVKRR
jgi:hypothetical protein